MSNTGEATAMLNAYLNVHRGVTLTGIAAEYVKLHIGQPGSAGTANASALATRNQITFNAASGSAMTLSSIGSYTMTATETLTHCSRHDNATAGTFLGSHDLTTPVPVINGSVVSFTTFTMSCGPAAV